MRTPLILAVTAAAWMMFGLKFADAEDAAPVAGAVTVEQAAAVSDAEAFAAQFDSMRDTIARYRQARLSGDGRAAASLEQAIRELDRAAHQRDAYACGLYWYTDLEAAKRAAARTGRPILSLRLLGRLDEEYSCANSRFFRTALYADARLAATLREQFVLHWQSVRPVPIITIDMGDGRVMKRTITGNSAHYVLDQHGRVVDVLPGLYHARAFESRLAVAAAQARMMATMDDQQCRSRVAQWHAERGDALDAQWRSLAGEHIAPADANDAVWGEVANHFAHDEALDANSRRLMQEKHLAFGANAPAPRGPNAGVAGQRAIAKYAVEAPMLRVVRNFQRMLAIDTARNEHHLHREIHRWFAAGDAPMDFDRLNSRVYAELFLTPEDDPWLGMAPPDVYSALDAGGVVVGGDGGADREVVAQLLRLQRGAEGAADGEVGGEVGPGAAGEEDGRDGE